MAATGGKIKTAGARPSDQLIRLDFQIDGVDKSTAEFKAVQRGINKRIRETMVRVGERDLLPTIRTRIEFQWMASSLKIHKERSGVFVGTKLPGAGIKSNKGRPTDRALGYIDFGGRWHSVGKVRQGKRAILNTTDEKRTLIDARVMEAIAAEFNKDTSFEVDTSGTKAAVMFS